MERQTLCDAEAQTVVSEWSIIDQIAEARGHLGPPEGAFSIADYVRRVRASGGHISEVTAMRALKAEMDAGRLDGKKCSIDGTERWYFWDKSE